MERELPYITPLRLKTGLSDDYTITMDGLINSFATARRKILKRPPGGVSVAKALVVSFYHWLPIGYRAEGTNLYNLVIRRGGGGRLTRVYFRRNRWSVRVLGREFRYKKQNDARAKLEALTKTRSRDQERQTQRYARALLATRGICEFAEVEGATEQVVGEIVSQKLFEILAQETK